MALGRYELHNGRLQYSGQRGEWVRHSEARMLVDLAREIHRIRSLSADYEPSADECLQLDELLQRCVPLL